MFYTKVSPDEIGTTPTVQSVQCLSRVFVLVRQRAARVARCIRKNPTGRAGVIQFSVAHEFRFLRTGKKAEPGFEEIRRTRGRPFLFEITQIRCQLVVKYVFLFRTIFRAVRSPTTR